MNRAPESKNRPGAGRSYNKDLPYPPREHIGTASPRNKKVKKRNAPSPMQNGGRGQAGRSLSKKNRENRAVENIKKFFTPRVTMYFVIGTVLVVLGICMLVNILIGVRNIEIVGADMAERGELMNAAGIEEGSGYFSYNTRSSEESVLRLIPCVSDVSITKSVFGKVTITVTEKKAFWYTEVFGEYYALSEELEVIRRSEKKAPLISRGLVRIDFPQVKSAVLGKKIEFSDDGRDCSFIDEFLAEVRESKLYKEGRLDQICIETKFEIFVVADMKYKIALGKYLSAKVKLDTVIKALNSEIFEGEGKWTLDVSNISNIASRKDGELNFDYLRPEN